VVKFGLAGVRGAKACYAWAMGFYEGCREHIVASTAYCRVSTG
jgi:hypothetical protein